MFENLPRGSRYDKLSKESNSIKNEVWLDTKQAAEYLGISETALRIMICRRKIKYHKLGIRNRYLLDDLREAICPSQKDVISGN